MIRMIILHSLCRCAQYCVICETLYMYVCMCILYYILLYINCLCVSEWIRYARERNNAHPRVTHGSLWFRYRTANHHDQSVVNHGITINARRADGCVSVPLSVRVHPCFPVPVLGLCVVMRVLIRREFPRRAVLVRFQNRVILSW